MVDLLQELKKTKSLSGKIAFLAHKEEIEKALAAGYAKKDIWRVLKEKKLISISYEQFVHYTKKIIEKSAKNEPASPSNNPDAGKKQKKFTYTEKNEEELI